ncbi:hypothetical protein [Halomicrobium sp. LC1Hm]|uniref:hypothetical protein n=1 Tax=Halomicrobium sp. LC1Hm TaxID=2610902 RepID=UPI00129853A0|nr:hypothetical protein [Halomicrobium sp. LC1Hm]QGA84279.1 hypothetical protein LC1Hm_3262 [Halomicrobium sp. LC1Hm]
MYERVADLKLTVDEYELADRRRDTSSGFTRRTTTVALHGDGEVGRGEDVTYEPEDHDSMHALTADLAGEYTLDSFSDRLDDIDLWPEPPTQDPARHYRRWAFESAALDLALKQAGRTLGDALDRTYDPVRFVVSTRLSEDGDGRPTTDRVEAWLDIDPGIEFKLDPTPDWDAELIAALAATDAVRVVDLKAYYEGTDVDTPIDAEFYRHVAEGLPDAVVEDAAITDETRSVFEGREERLSWDYPITGIASIEALPVEPSWLNCKPSRFGTVESLLESIAYCEQRGIQLYGGGQFELGVGRGQIQALASLCYPDAPNDVAPGEYNAPEPQAGLPSSPLEPTARRGFGW